MPHRETMTKRAISPHFIRFLPSSTAFSSPPTRAINFVRSQRKMSKAKPVMTGRVTWIKSVKIYTKSLKSLGGVMLFQLINCRLDNIGDGPSSQKYRGANGGIEEGVMSFRYLCFFTLRRHI